MTKETQEQTESKGRLLIVDDNPHYLLNAVKAAKSRGYDVDVALDLKGARDYLQSGNYAGVITDLEFYEEGINSRKSNLDGDCDPNDLEGIVDYQWTWRKDSSGKNVRVPIFERGTEVYETLIKTLKRTNRRYMGNQVSEDPLEFHSRSNSELREEIVSELATEKYVSQLHLLDSASKRMDGMFGWISLDKLEREIMEDPPLGYEVIKYVQRHEIPFAVVTSVGHGQHCIPALFQTGLADPESIIIHEAVRYKNRKERVKEDSESYARIMDDFKRGIITEEEKELELDKFFETNEENVNRFGSLVLDNAILVMEGGKQPLTYRLAIDMLEGKIDETRPYKVDEGAAAQEER